MTVNVYNTMTRRKEPLEPRDAGKIGIYACGPTVYNFIHIGNARTFLNFDMIRRYLEHRGFQVDFVRNVTDIDDKIINRAAEEGTTPKQIAEKYEKAFHDDMERLGVEAPTHEPRATETIPEMIGLVETLIDRGLAYVVEGNVWFSVRKLPGYGKLSGRSLDEMRAGERVEPEPGKEDPMDFALWKRSKPGEPAWESPWGPGRPGWHLECSAMSRKFLGAAFDIHGGAQDLIFPHHENELAQSEGAYGEDTFVRYWLHGGLLNLDREKMSKSLGNIMLLRDLLDAGWEPNTFRMLMLSTHYRNPLDFGKAGLEQARANVERLATCLANLDFAIDSGAPEDGAKTGVLATAVGEAKRKFVEVMDDDFNTAEALAAVFGLVKQANTLIEGQATVPGDRALKEARTALVELTRALGVDIESAAVPVTEIDEARVEALLGEREEARKARDFSRADQVREQLVAMGVEIEDTPRGPRWKIKA